MAGKIAKQFNLDSSEVEKVFEEDRKEHESEREAIQTKRLQKLVDNGTITDKQKTAIEAKLKEVRAEREKNRDSMDDLSDEQRKAKMDEHRAELESWAKQQGIDLSKLKDIFMPGGHRGGPGGHHGGREHDDEGREDDDKEVETNEN